MFRRVANVLDGIALLVTPTLRFGFVFALILGPVSAHLAH